MDISKFSGHVASPHFIESTPVMGGSGEAILAQPMEVRVWEAIALTMVVVGINVILALT